MYPGELVRFMPEKMKAACLKAEIDWDRTEEIRIRTGKPVFLYINNREYILKNDGELLSAYSDEGETYIAGENDVRQILDKMSGYSLYAYEDELRQGYFTLEGGHRVGLAGKAVVEKGAVKALKEIQFLNIRIAHEKKNCSRKVIRSLIENGRPKHSLIISPPGCGKTTLLRDLIRLLSDGFYYEEHGKRKHFDGITVGVVDERSEIGASVRGMPSMDLGIRTDLIDGCPKREGIFMLLRSMAPKVIAVDEIGDERDFEAIRQAVNSGCIILATVHGASREEMEKKKVFTSFLQEQIFERCVILSGKNGKGTVERVEVME